MHKESTLKLNTKNAQRVHVNGLKDTYCFSKVVLVKLENFTVIERYLWTWPAVQNFLY